jgi:hypothetical protein
VKFELQAGQSSFPHFRLLRGNQIRSDCGITLKDRPSEQLRVPEGTWYATSAGIDRTSYAQP